MRATRDRSPVAGAATAVAAGAAAVVAAAALAIVAALVVGGPGPGRVDSLPSGGTEAASADHFDWPEFRGPRRDGISQETGFLTSWPAGGPEVLWQRPLGVGYSAISAVGGRLYTMYGADGVEWVGAFDADSGEQLWRFRSDGLFRDVQGDGPRATPTVADGLVYTIGARAMLHAIDAESGHLVWGHDLRREYGAEPPTWGYASSPLAEGALLLVDVGGRSGASIVAFDRMTGREVWRSGDDPAGYAAPIAITVGGVRQAVFFTGRSVVAVAPDSGEILWRTGWRTSFDVNAATPIFVPPDGLFVSSGYDVGAALFRIAARGDGASIERLWRNREMKNQFSSSVLVDGYIYGFDNAILKCIEAAAGEAMWRARGFGHGSLFWADGYLFVLGERGQLALVEATPGAFQEVARAGVMQGKTWTVPTLSQGRLYLRNERQMRALDLSPGTSP